MARAEDLQSLLTLEETPRLSHLARFEALLPPNTTLVTHAPDRPLRSIGMMGHADAKIIKGCLLMGLSEIYSNSPVWQTSAEIFNLVADALRMGETPAYIIPLKTRLVVVERGNVLLPHIADCLGIVTRANTGRIVTSHLMAFERYSDDDIIAAVEKQVEYDTEGTTGTVDIAIAGYEDWDLLENSTRQRYSDVPWLANFTLGTSNLTRDPAKLRRKVQERFPSRLEISSLRMHINKGKPSKRVGHCLIASTAQREIEHLQY